MEFVIDLANDLTRIKSFGFNQLRKCPPEDLSALNANDPASSQKCAKLRKSLDKVIDMLIGSNQVHILFTDH